MEITSSSEATVTIKATEAFEYFCKWDGCIDIIDGDGCGVHICDLDGFIAQLREVDARRSDYFEKKRGYLEWKTTAKSKVPYKEDMCVDGNGELSIDGEIIHRYRTVEEAYRDFNILSLVIYAGVYEWNL